MAVWTAALIVGIAFYAITWVVEGPFMASLEALRKRMKLSDSVAGATLLALGTSAPEVATALVALFADGANPAVGVGSIVGSAIFQITVVVGVVALTRPATLDWRPILRDAISYGLAVLLLIYCLADDRLTVGEGVALVAGYGVYLTLMWLWSRVERSRAAASDEAEMADRAQDPLVAPSRPSLVIVTESRASESGDGPAAAINALASRRMVAAFVLCLGLIGVACYWLVVAAEALALAFRVPSAIVALTILAGGSSIPELVASWKLARADRGDMAIANAIGSNTFDVLISLGLPVLLYTAVHGDVHGLGGASVQSSMWLLVASLGAVIAILALLRFRASRGFGLFLVVFYVAYVVAAYQGRLGG